MFSPAAFVEEWIKLAAPLTPEQQRAFDAAKRQYQELQRKGVGGGLSEADQQTHREVTERLKKFQDFKRDRASSIPGWAMKGTEPPASTWRAPEPRMSGQQADFWASVNRAEAQREAARRQQKEVIEDMVRNIQARAQELRRAGGSTGHVSYTPPPEFMRPPAYKVPRTSYAMPVAAAAAAIMGLGAFALQRGRKSRARS